RVVCVRPADEEVSHEVEAVGAQRVVDGAPVVLDDPVDVVSDRPVPEGGGHALLDGECGPIDETSNHLLCVPTVHVISPLARCTYRVPQGWVQSSWARKTPPEGFGRGSSSPTTGDELLEGAAAVDRLRVRRRQVRLERGRDIEDFVLVTAAPAEILDAGHGVRQNRATGSPVRDVHHLHLSISSQRVWVHGITPVPTLSIGGRLNVDRVPKRRPVNFGPLAGHSEGYQRPASTPDAGIRKVRPHPVGAGARRGTGDVPGQLLDGREGGLLDVPTLLAPDLGPRRAGLGGLAGGREAPRVILPDTRGYPLNHRVSSGPHSSPPEGSSAAETRDRTSSANTSRALASRPVLPARSRSARSQSSSTD